MENDSMHGKQHTDTNPLPDFLQQQTPLQIEGNHDLLSGEAEDSAPVVESWTLGTAEFTPPAGPADSEVYLMNDNGGCVVTMRRLLEVHHERSQGAPVVGLRLIPATEWRPYERERQARKDKIKSYVRDHPAGLTKNKIILAVKGNRNRLGEDIEEMILAGELVRSHDRCIRLPDTPEPVGTGVDTPVVTV